MSFRDIAMANVAATAAAKKRAAANAKYAQPNATYNPNNPKQTRFPRIIWPVNPLDQITSTSIKVNSLAVVVQPVPTGDANVAAAGVYTVSKTNVVDTQKVPYKPDGLYYSLDMDFALGLQDAKILRYYKVKGAPKPVLTADQKKNWGHWLGNPLVDPSTNAIYLIRVRITQHHIEPLMSGFVVKWTLPTGWRWADGHRALTTIEVVSNPLVIIRRCISPAKLTAGTKGGFVASVVRMVTGY
jgi:hypothetical protein